MYGYGGPPDSYWEPPSVNERERDEVRFVSVEHDPIKEEFTTCRFEGEVEGTLVYIPGYSTATFYWTCPDCGNELSEDEDLDDPGTADDDAYDRWKEDW